MRKKIISEFTEVENLDQLKKKEQELVKASIEAASRAYAPYSSFMVGASVLLEDGQVLTGNNRENAAFPSGSCAERTVLSYTGANYPDKKIIAMAICGTKDGIVTDKPVTPCGNCRQLIAEEEDRTGSVFKIILYGEESIIVAEGIDPLLPLRFRFESYNS